MQCTSAQLPIEAVVIGSGASDRWWQTFAIPPLVRRRGMASIGGGRRHSQWGSVPLAVFAEG